MTVNEFLIKLPRLSKTEIDHYLQDAKTKGNLFNLFNSYEKRLNSVFLRRWRIDKLSAQLRYLYISLLAHEAESLAVSSILLNQDAKKRVIKLAHQGTVLRVNIFKELVASLLDSGIYPDFDLSQDYALRESPRILLLSSFHGEAAGKDKIQFAKLSPPQGITRICAFLRSLGIDADFFNTDRILENELKGKIAVRKYDYIGISSLDFTFADDLKLIFDLKREFPNKVYMLGGYGSVFNENERINLFENTPLEIIGRGWGEFGLGNSLLSVGHKPKDPLTTFKENIGFYVKDARIPSGVDTGIKTDYSLDDFRAITLIFDPRMYSMPQNITFCMTSNYCPNGCIYCSCTNFLKPQIVLRLFPEDVVAYIKRVKRVYKKVTLVHFDDDNFAGSYITRQGLREGGELWIEKFTALLKKAPFKNTQYSVNITADAINSKMIQSLKTAGVINFRVGIESFSDPVLKGMCKGANEKQNIYAVEESLKNGFITTINLMFFTPWDTLDTLWHTIDVTVKLIHQAADSHLVLRIFVGVEPNRSSAMLGLKNLDLLSETISVYNYQEETKTRALPGDFKTKILYQKVFLEDSSQSRSIKDANESETKEKFLAGLNLNILNFRSSVAGDVISIHNRMIQRLSHTDSLTSLLMFYNIYSLADKMLDFNKDPFIPSDKLYFKVKCDELEKRILHSQFEGPLIQTILESDKDRRKIMKRLKITNYLFLTTGLPKTSGLFFSFQKLIEEGIMFIKNVAARHIKTAELCGLRADFEMAYFLDKAAEYHRSIQNNDIATRLLTIKSALFTPELKNLLRKNITPSPLLENIAPVFEQFINDTELLRLKVAGIAEESL